MLAKGSDNDTVSNAVVAQVIPAPRKVDENVPAIARRFLEQAFSTLHAPDAAAVMAASAVDAMLKERRFAEGSLYERIDKAVSAHVLTEDMGKWAHHVRLESNRPRHADINAPHLSPEEARQTVDFADALAYFLYVLSARIQRGIENSKAAINEARTSGG